jgi:hypothetical protein
MRCMIKEPKKFDDPPSVNDEMYYGAHATGARLEGRASQSIRRLIIHSQSMFGSSMLESDPEILRGEPLASRFAQACVKPSEATCGRL